jgi:hypothetical protein
MIIVKLNGGLGNQMFQYAFGRRIAYENNLQLKLDISGFKDDIVYRRKYSLGCFNIQEDFATEEDLRRAKFLLADDLLGKFVRLLYMALPYYSRYNVIEKEVFKVDPRIFRKYSSANFVGYWQNEEYFRTIEKKLRKDFEFKNEESDSYRHLFKNIISTNSVGIHIRNYTKNFDEEASKRDAESYNLLNKDYYNSAINLLNEKEGEVELFAFTDDVEWLKNCLPSASTVHLVKVEDQVDYEDLRLFSACKHQIMANSSFSWWAAWLNKNPQKRVIAPKLWFRNSPYDTSRLIPEKYIKL